MTHEWGKFAMTPADVAKSIGIQDEKTILRWLRSGRLKGVNFRGQIGWRVRPDDVAEFLRKEVDKQFQGKSGEDWMENDEDEKSQDGLDGEK